MSRDSDDPGKLVAGELLRGEPPPCVFAGGARQRQTFRGRLEPVQSGVTSQRSPNPEPCRSNGRVPSPPAFDDKILRSARLMIGRMTAPSARMMLLPGLSPEKYVFR